MRKRLSMGKCSMAVLLAAMACSSRPESSELLQGKISGWVTVSGAPVQGARVFAYSSSDGGERRVLGESEITSELGTFSITIPGTYEGPIELEALGAGAQYIESASGATASFTSRTLLRAHVLEWEIPDVTLNFVVERGDERDDVVINPFTEFAFAYGEALTATRAGMSPAVAREQATRMLLDHLEYDFFSTVPASLVDGTVGDVNDVERAGALAAGLSMLARRVAVASSVSPGSISSLTVLDALVRDVTDDAAVLDGKSVGASSTLSLGSCAAEVAFCALSPHSFRADWAESVALFLSDSRNASGVLYGDVQQLIERVAFRTGPLWHVPGVSPDRSGPQIVIDGLQDGGIVATEAQSFRITITDAFSLEPGTELTLRRGDTELSLAKPPELLRDETRKTEHTIDVVLDTTQFADGPLELVVTAHDQAKPRNTTQLVWTVHVENSGPGSILGTVTLGGRVAGAQVSAFDVTGGTQSEEPLTAPVITDEQGGFEMTLPEAPHVTEILLVAENPVDGVASFVDPATGQTILLSADDAIETLITSYEDGDHINAMITPLTHIATAFARGLWHDPIWHTPPADPGLFATAIEDAYATFASHFDDSGPVIDFVNVRPADVTNAEEAGTLNAQVRYGLVLAGMSQLALTHAEESEATFATTNTLSLTRLLARDLGAAGAGEPLFNGRNGQGILRHAAVDLTSYVTRVDLAQHIVLFVEENAHDATNLVEADLFSFLDKLSLDENERLYPADEPGLAYDRVAPGPVVFASPTPDEGEVLRGLIELQAQASDNRKLVGFQWQAPLGITDATLDTQAGIVGPWTLTGKLDLDAFADGPLVITAVAVDEAQSQTQVDRMVIVDKTPPSVAITGAQAAGSALAEGELTGASELLVSVRVEDANAVQATYRIGSGAHTPIPLADDGTAQVTAALVNGANTVTVRAIDVAGNAAEASATYLRDATPPTVASPEPNHAARMGNEMDYTVSITGPDAGTLTYDTSDTAEVHLVSGAHFVKWADRYTSQGPNLPEWRFVVADDRTPDDAILAEYKVLQGSEVIVDWHPMGAVVGTGYNRALVVSSGIHPTLGEVSGTFELLVRATDGFGNVSSPTTVTFTQTVKPPALRVFGFDNDRCDSRSVTYFNLGDTLCPDAPRNNFAQTLNGSLPSRLRISQYQVQNPNRIPARVRLRNPLVNLAARVGVKYSIPETNGFQWDTLATCPPDDYGDILQDGRCYSLPWPGRDGSESTTSHLGILDRVVYWINGQTPSTCAGCDAGEYEIPPGTCSLPTLKLPICPSSSRVLMSSTIWTHILICLR